MTKHPGIPDVKIDSNWKERKSCLAWHNATSLLCKAWRMLMQSRNMGVWVKKAAGISFSPKLRLFDDTLFFVCIWYFGPHVQATASESKSVCLQDIWGFACFSFSFSLFCWKCPPPFYFLLISLFWQRNRFLLLKT